MNKVQTTFLLGCIPARLLLTGIVKEVNNGNLRIISSVALSAIGFGFLIIYAFGLRKTGIETGGTKIWWNNLRPIHGLLYLSAAYLVYSNAHNDAWKVLLLDTIIGLVAHLTKNI
ncbi:conserved hypothetical protein [Gammaproteobacteria bacterium]